jgi:hypothetical protein
MRSRTIARRAIEATTEHLRTPCSHRRSAVIWKKALKPTN